MSDMSVKIGNPTMLEKLVKSTPLKVTSESPLVNAGDGILASSVVGLGSFLTADKMNLITLKTANKAVIPVISLGIAATGVLIADHAIKKAENPLEKTLITGAGLTTSVVGLEVAGRSMNLSMMQPATAIAKAVTKSPVTLPVIGVTSGLALSTLAAKNIKKDGIGLVNGTSLALGAGVTLLSSIVLTEIPKVNTAVKVVATGAVIASGVALTKAAVNQFTQKEGVAKK